VVDHFKEVHTKRNEVLLEVGEVCNKCYFIVEGCIKLSTYNRNGDEGTTDLSFEKEWRTGISSFINNQPSNQRIVTVEPSKLLMISKHDFQNLRQTVPNVDYIYKEVIEQYYTRSIDRAQTLMNMDALSRVKWLLSKHPMIFTRLSNRLIASYLGISEATLSRLKTKL
jgi:CRP-like cAMP-binding protein